MVEEGSHFQSPHAAFKLPLCNQVCCMLLLYELDTSLSSSGPPGGACAVDVN